MLVYFSVSLIVLLGFVGLAVDVGRMELRTLQLQTVADDGALTAAAELQRQNASWQSVTAAEVANALTQANLPTAIVASQPSVGSGPYSTDFAAVQVSVTQQFPLFFMGLLTHNNQTTVSAHSVAIVPPCVFLMNNNGLSLWMASATMYSPCSVYANYGIVVDLFSILNSQAKVAGPPGQSGEILGNFYNPTIYNSRTLPDPLAYIKAPVFQSCNYTAKKYTTPAAILPGTYCGGLTVDGTTVTMQPGLYIFTGGVTIKNGATLLGTGVTMYLTKGGGSGFGMFQLIDSAMQVSAPLNASGGGIPGIVIMGDRNWSGGPNDFQFTALYLHEPASKYQGDGIIYTTNTGIEDWQVDLSCNNYITLVTDYLYEYNSNFMPKSNYSSLPGGNPLHIAASLVQ